MYCVQSAQCAQQQPVGLAKTCPARRPGFVLDKIGRERRSRFDRGLHPRTGRKEVVLEGWALKDLGFLTQGSELGA
eukprot:4185745-Pyramimonas_sp.AAC.1